MTTVELSPYLVLILVGFLPNEIWRAFGLVLARGLNEDSEIVVWSRAVATAILAAVIAKLILFPSGTLDNIPLAVRIAAAILRRRTASSGWHDVGLAQRYPIDDHLPPADLDLLARHPDDTLDEVAPLVDRVLEHDDVTPPRWPRPI